MKRYKLTRSPNPETHASGEVIFIKDISEYHLWSWLFLISWYMLSVVYQFPHYGSK